MRSNGACTFACMSIAVRQAHRPEQRRGAANETMAVETAAVRVGPAGQISPSEELITLTEATRHLPKVEGKKVPVCILCGDGAAAPIGDSGDEKKGRKTAPSLITATGRNTESDQAYCFPLRPLRQICLCSGMELAVDRLEPVGIDVRVDLRGRDVRVAEHFLDASQVRPVRHQVCREAVAQRVRRDVAPQPRPPDVFPHGPKDILAGQRPTRPREE